LQQIYAEKPRVKTTDYQSGYRAIVIGGIIKLGVFTLHRLKLIISEKGLLTNEQKHTATLV
jgi:hypothetical protein